MTNASVGHLLYLFYLQRRKQFKIRGSSIQLYSLFRNSIDAAYLSRRECQVLKCGIIFRVGREFTGLVHYAQDGLKRPRELYNSFLLRKLNFNLSSIRNLARSAFCVASSRGTVGLNTAIASILLKRPLKESRISKKRVSNS